MKGKVEGIYVTGEGSAAMERVEEVRTIEGCGIEGDRYCVGTGFWTRYGDVCQVTLIEGEDLDYIQTELGIGIKEGQHRRTSSRAASGSWVCARRGSALARRSWSSTV